MYKRGDHGTLNAVVDCLLDVNSNTWTLWNRYTVFSGLTVAMKALHLWIIVTLCCCIYAYQGQNYKKSIVCGKHGIELKATCIVNCHGIKFTAVSLFNPACDVKATPSGLLYRILLDACSTVKHETADYTSYKNGMMITATGGDGNPVSYERIEFKCFYPKKREVGYEIVSTPISVKDNFVTDTEDKRRSVDNVEGSNGQTKIISSPALCLLLFGLVMYLILW